MADHTFSVSDIHCGACESAIRKSLSRLDGVQQVIADADSNRVSVVYDPSTVDVAALAERLQVAGYPVVS